MSLADELLADLEEAGLEGEDVPVDQNNEGDVDDIGEIDDLDVAMDTGQSGIDPNSIRSVARYCKYSLFYGSIVHGSGYIYMAVMFFK